MHIFFDMLNAYVGWSVSLPIVYLPSYISGRTPNMDWSVSLPIVYLPNYIQGRIPILVGMSVCPVYIFPIIFMVEPLIFTGNIPYNN